MTELIALLYEKYIQSIEKYSKFKSKMGKGCESIHGSGNIGGP